MKKLIGDKQLFAIEIEIIELKPTLWGKSCLWVNNCRLGDFDDENYLAPFLRSMYRIARKSQDYWLEELEGLSCKQIFYSIHPFYNDPDKLYDLTEQQSGERSRYDVFYFHWGENFDDWILDVIVNNSVCQFIWVHTPLRDADSFEVKNNIQCYSVKLEDVQSCYEELVAFVPDEVWPSLIPK